MPTTQPARSPHHSTVTARAAAGLVVVIGVFAGTFAAAVPAAQSLPAPSRLQTLTTSGAPFAHPERSAPSDHPVRSAPDSPTETTAVAALTAARALADGVSGPAVISPEVIRALGYVPVVRADLGSSAKPTGDCSSPVPLPAGFEPACQVHDLGYDLLRVAHRSGAAISPGLRSDLDSLLARQTRGSCDNRMGCVAMSEIAHAAVHLNTVRQGHGAPVEEQLPW